MTPAERIVAASLLLELGHRAAEGRGAEDGFTEMRDKQLAELSGVGEKTASLALESLVSLGAVDVEKRPLSYPDALTGESRTLDTKYVRLADNGSASAVWDMLEQRQWTRNPKILQWAPKRPHPLCPVHPEASLIHERRKTIQERWLCPLCAPPSGGPMVRARRQVAWTWEHVPDEQEPPLANFATVGAAGREGENLCGAGAHGHHAATDEQAPMPAKFATEAHGGREGECPTGTYPIPANFAAEAPPWHGSFTEAGELRIAATGGQQ
jgi:hypothetical protein